MKLNFDSLKRLHELSGLEHLLLWFLTASLEILALDNNDCDDAALNRLRSLAKRVCSELDIDAHL